MDLLQSVTAGYLSSPSWHQWDKRTEITHIERKKYTYLRKKYIVILFGHVISTYNHDIIEVAKIEAVQEELKFIKLGYTEEGREFTFTIDLSNIMIPSLNQLGLDLPKLYEQRLLE